MASIPLPSGPNTGSNPGGRVQKKQLTGENNVKGWYTVILSLIHDQKQRVDLGMQGPSNGFYILKDRVQLFRYIFIPTVPEVPAVHLAASVCPQWTH